MTIDNPTTTTPPATSTVTHTWTMGEQVGDDVWKAMREVAGMTVEPSVIERLDANEE